jgi:hypothetical protein
MSDLEGKAIGISSFGSDTDIGIRLTPQLPNFAELRQTSQYRRNRFMKFLRSGKMQIKGERDITGSAPSDETCVLRSVARLEELVDVCMSSSSDRGLVYRGCAGASCAIVHVHWPSGFIADALARKLSRTAAARVAGESEPERGARAASLCVVEADYSPAALSIGSVLFA